MHHHKIKTILRKKTLFQFVALIIFPVLFTGCALLFFTRTEIPQNSLLPEKLQLKSGVELSNLRIDLYRNTQSTTSTNSDGTTETETTIMAYHPIGFYICRGVFYDINRNLSLVIPDLFGIKPNDDYCIREITPGFLSDSEYLVTKKGNIITTSHEKVIFPDKSTINISGDSIIIDNNSILNSNEIIAITPERIVYDPKSLLGSLNVSKIIKTPEGYKMPMLLNNSWYSQPESNRILLDKHFEVTRQEDAIKFEMAYYTTTYLYKLPNGYLYIGNFGNNQQVRIEKDRIELIMNGRTIKTFILESATSTNI
jgi:hypothetical protein